MSRFGSITFASKPVPEHDSALPPVSRREDFSASAPWLRPGYYLMRLRQYYRNRSEAAFRFTASSLSRQQNLE
jgi:hypothetical protein